MSAGDQAERIAWLLHSLAGRARLTGTGAELMRASVVRGTVLQLDNCVMAKHAGTLTEREVRDAMVSFDVVTIEKPTDLNVIIGQAHFIKTVEDLHEALVGASPHLRFGLAFCEASADRLVRKSGNDAELTQLAAANALAIAAGHTFVIFLRDGFPVIVLNQVTMVPEVCGIYCATANQVDVLVGVTERGRGVIGVIDGSPPVGIETAADVTHRRDLLRSIGYKL